MKTVLKIIATMIIVAIGCIAFIYFAKEAKNGISYFISLMLSQIVIYPAVTYYLDKFNVKL
jgi:hypothetical protein